MTNKTEISELWQKAAAYRLQKQKGEWLNRATFFLKRKRQQQQLLRAQQQTATQAQTQAHTGTTGSHTDGIDEKNNEKDENSPISSV